MKHAAAWKPSKYVMSDGVLVVNKNTAELAVSSRLIGRLLTDRYQPTLATYARGRLLDLGCGKVPLYEAYRDYVDDVTCVDWPSTLHASEHVDMFCDLTQPLPLDDGSFDTLLSSDVIEHLPDPVLAFSEMGRILRPGGMLILNTPFFYMLHEVPFDFYRHTRYSLQRLCTLSGLDVVELEEIGGLPEVLADLVGKGVSTIPLLGGPMATMLQWMAYALSHTRIGRRARIASAPRFPLGYFLVARKAG